MTEPTENFLSPDTGDEMSQIWRTAQLGSLRNQQPYTGQKAELMKITRRRLKIQRGQKR